MGTIQDKREVKKRGREDSPDFLQEGGNPCQVAVPPASAVHVYRVGVPVFPDAHCTARFPKKKDFDGISQWVGFRMVVSGGRFPQRPKRCL